VGKTVREGESLAESLRRNNRLKSPGSHAEEIRVESRPARESPLARNLDACLG
jgi:hypothetical protein